MGESSLIELVSGGQGDIRNICFQLVKVWFRFRFLEPDAGMEPGQGHHFFKQLLDGVVS